MADQEMTGDGMAAPGGRVDPDLSCWAWWPRLHAAVERGEPGRLGPVADRALAAALAHAAAYACVVATVREVARVRAQVLADPAGARDSLAAEARWLADRGRPVDEWLALAESYHTVLGDDDGAGRCLTGAANLARQQDSVADLAGVAAALGRLLDLSTGVALAREAERRLPGRWYAAGDVAVARLRHRDLDSFVSVVH